MFMSLQRRFSHTLEKRAERRIVVQIDMQYQRIDKQANEVLKLDMMTVCDRRSNEYICLSAIARKQHTKGGQQGHKKCHSFTLTQLFERHIERGINGKALCRATECLSWW